MSMRQSLDVGQKYLIDSIRNRAQVANVPIDDLFWYEPLNRDVSELTVTSRGKKETYVIDTLDLEDAQRRNTLDQKADLIVNDLS